MASDVPGFLPDFRNSRCATGVRRRSRAAVTGFPAPCIVDWRRGVTAVMSEPLVLRLESTVASVVPELLRFSRW